MEQKRAENTAENPGPERADQTQERQDVAEQVQEDAAEERKNQRGYQ